MCIVYISAAHIPYLYEGAEGAVCGVVCDEESHVLVAQFHRSRTIHGAQRDLWPLSMSSLLLFISHSSSI